MEPTAYKDFKVSRGFTYHYYLAAPRDTDKPFILLCHGFPSTSYDWHRQIVFFSEEGYGLIVPDMLGYGGSDKPTTTESYKMNAMAQDLIDILEYENAQDVVVIGHDWGSIVVSRLAYLYQERFLAFGFLAATYMPPDPDFNYKKVSEELDKTFGYNLFGYWEFCSSNEAPKIIEEHFDSFYSIAFPHDPTLWKDHLAPTGQVNKWLTSNRIEKRPAYITEEELEQHRKNLLQGGLSAPCCWYKAIFEGHIFSDGQNKDVDPNKLFIHKPIFFGAALYDYICVADLAKAGIKKFCQNATVVDFTTDHWIMYAAADQLNTELATWIKTFRDDLSSC